MNKAEPVAALEIGTSHTELLVGEPLENGRLKIAARGIIASSGIRKGQIIDVTQASCSIESVLKSIEATSSYGISYAYLVLSGPHVRVTRYTSQLELPSSIVTEEDLQEIYNRSFDNGLKTEERTILESFEIDYGLDRLEGILSPKGMTARQLRLNTLCIHGSTARINDAKNAAAKAKLEIEDVSYAGTCAANAVLTEQMKNAGVAVIDLGGGTTDMAVYSDGHLMHASTISVGGDHVTNDIRQAFSISKNSAEHLKIKEGNALITTLSTAERAEICPVMPGLVQLPVSRRALETIINARMRELFSIILSELDSTGFLCRIASGAGIILTGGGARMKGIVELAQNTFGCHVRIGQLIPAVEGFEDDPAPEAHASAIGMLLTAAAQSVPESSGIFSRIFGGLKK